MAREEKIPEYGTIFNSAGEIRYRTRVKDENGKQVYFTGVTREEVYNKVKRFKKGMEKRLEHLRNPTVREYSEKWLQMHSAFVQPSTLKGYRNAINKYILGSLGDMYLSEVTADDIRMAMVPLSRCSMHVYATVNMLVKSIFYSAECNELIDYNPTEKIQATGGIPSKKKEALTDEQVAVLLDTLKGLQPYTFVMIGLFAGLRREEILALKWDCVFLDREVPYISVKRAWHSDSCMPTITDTLKTQAAKRDIPIPKCLADHLAMEKQRSVSEYVICNRQGEPLSESQYYCLWNQVRVRSTMERTSNSYINGMPIKKTFKPVLGQRCRSRDYSYTLDFHVTPHILRHTYITNLIHAGVDPKTVQYLAGHKNSSVTMDIYAKVKYNKPSELSAVVKKAFN